MLSCSLANSAMSAQARVQSSSRTLPISCIVWRQRVWTHAKISCIVSITRCLGRTLPPGGVSPLPSAFTWRDFTGTDTSIGDTSAPQTSPPDVVSACLASRRCQSVPCIKGRMRSETMFQWSLDGGLRFTAIFWPCVSSWGISPVHIPTWVRWPRLRNRETPPDEPGPLQAAGSRQCGA